MLDDLKKAVCDANIRLAEEGLAVLSWGNVSGIDRDSGNVVIKPSGVMYGELTHDRMVVVSLATGETVEGDLNPSSDTPTHLELYRAFASVGGVIHTHSLYATAWAQGRREIPVYGTTHADAFYGTIPCTRRMEPAEIRADYELNTGKVIVERFADIDPEQVPGVLVCEHGPFAWGASPEKAVQNGVLLEYVARLASETIHVEPYPRGIRQVLLDKHYLRKHGDDAYYGQG